MNRNHTTERTARFLRSTVAAMAAVCLGITAIAGCSGDGEPGNPDSSATARQGETGGKPTPEVLGDPNTPLEVRVSGDDVPITLATSELSEGLTLSVEKSVADTAMGGGNYTLLGTISGNREISGMTLVMELLNSKGEVNRDLEFDAFAGAARTAPLPAGEELKLNVTAAGGPDLTSVRLKVKNIQ